MDRSVTVFHQKKRNSHFFTLLFFSYNLSRVVFVNVIPRWIGSEIQSICDLLCGSAVGYFGSFCLKELKINSVPWCCKCCFRGFSGVKNNNLGQMLNYEEVLAGHSAAPADILSSSLSLDFNQLLQCTLACALHCRCDAGCLLKLKLKLCASYNFKNVRFNQKPQRLSLLKQSERCTAAGASGTLVCNYSNSHPDHHHMHFCDH